MRNLVKRGFAEALKPVRADLVCSEVCKIKGGNLKIGDVEYKLSRFKRKFLVAVGKAACPMAKHMLEIMDFDDGLVATDKPCELGSEKIEVFRSSHPLPNIESVRAAECLIELANDSKRDDLFIFLVSGGASSLIEKPKINLDEYNDIVNYLLKNHFSIREINIVRKALSKIKGGKILRLVKGEVLGFVISDVIGDDLSTIGSGLTYFDSFTQKDFSDICSRLKEFDICGYDYDTLTENEYLSKRVTNYVIANNSKAGNALGEYLKCNGFNVLNLGYNFSVEIEQIRDYLYESIDKAIQGKLGVNKPFALVFGGEPTVEVRRNGVGGRCQHLALLMLERLKNIDGNFLFSCFATDGKDGNSNYAGAFVDKLTIERVRQLKLNEKDYLANFNSSKFFELTNSAIDSFDTMTNVADLGVFLFS